MRADPYPIRPGETALSATSKPSEVTICTRPSRPDRSRVPVWREGESTMKSVRRLMALAAAAACTLVLAGGAAHAAVLGINQWP